MGGWNEVEEKQTATFINTKGFSKHNIHTKKHTCDKILSSKVQHNPRLNLSPEQRKISKNFKDFLKLTWSEVEEKQTATDFSTTLQTEAGKYS